MLIDVKTKITEIHGEKYKKVYTTFILDKDVFAQAEYTIMSLMDEEENAGRVFDYEIMSLKVSAIKELATQYQGNDTFVATLKYTFTDDAGNEKNLKYKVLLWADDLTQANQRAHELAREGYDMYIEGIKQVDYTYIPEENEESDER